MLINRTLQLALASLMLGVITVGCGRSEQPLGYVEGKILLDGQPVANAIVEFQPEGKGRQSIGETEPDGKYKLRFSRTHWGAVPGKHKVMITTFSPTGDGRYQERIPSIYNTNTMLVREVQQHSNWLDFDLLSDTSVAQSQSAQ